MTRKEIDRRYDEFFGDGLWERDYKPHITVFAEQCVRATDAAEGWTSSEEELPEIGDRIIAKMPNDEIHYGVYSAHNEFDLNFPKKGDYRGRWYKFSRNSIKQWKHFIHPQ